MADLNKDTEAEGAGAKVHVQAQPQGAQSNWETWIHRLDRVSDEGGSALGALITLTALVISIAYSILVVRAFILAPTKSNVDVLWSANDGVVPEGPSFPISVRCEADDGCHIVAAFSDEAMMADGCRLALKGFGWESGDCRKVARGEVVSAFLCFSELPGDGLFVATGGDKFGASVLSLTEMSKGAVEKYMPVHTGRNSLMFVRTLNTTYAEVRRPPPPKAPTSTSRGGWALAGCPREAPVQTGQSGFQRCCRPR